MPYDTMLKRIRGEYLEMPGLRLTMAQAQRLCGVERTLCQRVLGTLVETGFLCVDKNGTYARAADDRPRPDPPGTARRRLPDFRRPRSRVTRSRQRRWIATIGGPDGSL
jgi:hypothetical protein